MLHMLPVVEVHLLKYLYFIWVFPFSATLYFSFTTIQKEILYFLLHYFYFKASFTR